MAELGVYYITIMPSMKGFTKAVNKQLKGAGSSGGKDYNGGFLSSIKNSAIGVALGNMAVRAGDAIVGGISTGIDRADTLRNFPRVMEAMGYSADDAEDGIKKIMERLRGLPASTQDVVRLTQAIADSTGDMGLAVDGALAFTDAMIAQGASSGEVAQAQGVLNRVLGKGNATVAQWQSLQSVMTPQLAATAEAILGAGHSTEELREKLNDGTVSWNEFLQTLVRLDTEGNGHMASFYEQAKANSDGIGTAIQNVTWRIGTGWANIINAVGVDKISGAINATSDFIASSMGGIAGRIEEFKERVGKTSILENLQTIMKNLGERFGSFGDRVKDAVDKSLPVIVDLIDKALQWLVDHGDEIGGRFDALAEAVGKVADKVSGALADALPIAVDFVSKFLEWMLEHGDVVAAAIAGVAAAIGAFNVAQGIQIALSTLPGIFSNLAEVLPMLGGLDDIPAALALIAEAGGPVGAAIGGISGALGFLAANPAVLAVAAIAGIVGALAVWITTTDEGKAAWDGFCKAVKDLVEGLKRDFKAAFDQIKQNLEDNKVQWGVFKGNVKGVIDSIVGFFLNLKRDVDNTMAAIRQRLDDTSLVWENFKQKVATTVENLRTTVVEKVEAIRTKVHDIADGIKTTVHDKFTAAKDTVLGIFDGIREGIREKLDAAWQTVRDIVDRIKGLFDFSWSLPAPQLPHITWDWMDVGGIVSIPTFGIDWYGGGGVFDSASVIGIGERGREAALPLNDATYSEIAAGITQRLDYGGTPTVLVTGNEFNVRSDDDIERIADAIALRTKRERGARL